MTEYDDHNMEFFIHNRILTPADHGRLTIERAKAMRVDYLGLLWARLVNWYFTRTAVAQLRSLDDAALKDIGLHRSGIESAVVGSNVKTESRALPAEKPHFCLQRTG